MKQMPTIKGISALILVTAVLAWVSSRLGAAAAHASALVVVIAGLQSVVAFAALIWSLSKSDRMFFSIFVSDALLRLAVLAVVVYLLCLRHMDYTGPLLSLGFSYLVFSLVQIPFFYRVR